MSSKPRSSDKTTVGRILLRYREADSALGVSRRTTLKLARELGVSETQVIHYALALLAKQALPSYEQDEGALSARQLETLRKLEPQDRMKETARLF